MKMQIGEMIRKYRKSKNMTQEDVRRILAKNIKNRRKELGITQIKLAELADISEPYMNDIERCQTWVSDKTLAKLAWALNLDLNELFINNEEQNQKTDKEKDLYNLFQKYKKELKNTIDKSFEVLLRDVIK